MFDQIISAAALEWSVPEDWIRATIATESNWDPQAFRDEPKIGDASRGLMQLLLTTARGLGYEGAPEGLFDPATNISLGTQLLADLRRRYGTDPRDVYSAYNSGRPKLWESSTQVASNVERFLRNLEKYKGPLLGGGLAMAALAVTALMLWGRKG